MQASSLKNWRWFGVGLVMDVGKVGSHKNFVFQSPVKVVFTFISGELHGENKLIEKKTLK